MLLFYEVKYSISYCALHPSWALFGRIRRREPNLYIKTCSKMILLGLTYYSLRLKFDFYYFKNIWIVFRRVNLNCTSKIPY
ncbi:hypothetical protein Bca4012_047756 [Brassica carinata]